VTAVVDEAVATRDPRRVASFVGLVVSRLGPRSLQLVGGTFLTLLVASRTASALAITFALTAHRLFLWFVYPVVGNLSDRTSTRVGRRVPYMAGALLTMAVCTWLWTLAPGYWLLVLAILGTRLAASANQMTSVVAVPEVFGRSRWIRAGGSIWIVGLAVSVILRGTVVATWNDADPSTWNLTFRLAAIFMAAAGVAVILLVREAPGVAAAAPAVDQGRLRDRLREFASAPAARPLLLVAVALAVAGGATSRLFPVYAEQVLGATTAQLAVLPFIVAPLSLIVALVGISSAGRCQRRTWIVLVGVGVTAVGVVGVTATALWQPVAASVLLSGFLIAGSVALLPMFLRLLPARGSLGERLGLLAGPLSAAVVLGAYAAGILVDLTGDYRTLWWVTAAAGPVAAGAALGLRQPEARARGGIGTLLRAGGSGGRLRRPSRDGRAMFHGALGADDLDAAAAVTAIRDFADAALMSGGDLSTSTARVVDLVERDLTGEVPGRGPVTVVDEHGRKHTDPVSVDRVLDAVCDERIGPWRPLDHPSGPGVVADVSGEERIVVVASSDDPASASLGLHRHRHDDPEWWRHPAQIDLESVEDRRTSRRRRRRVVVTLGRAFAWPLVRKLARQPVTNVEWARRARGALADLGGAWVKFGQLLASSPSFVGAEAADELRSLLDDAPAVPIDRVRSSIEAGLGAPVDQLFAALEPEPIGAASLAVVHRAVLSDGRVVAVKVLRPGIAAIVAADLDLLGRITGRLLSTRAPIATGMHRALGYLRIQMAEELDLVNECRHLELARIRFAEAGLDLVTAPEPITQLSSSTVLTMEFLDGVPLDRRAEADVAGRTSRAVEQAIKAWFLIAVRDGWFHGDVHAGNLLALRDGRVAFLDWGVTGRLSVEARELLADLIGAGLDLPDARDRLVDRLAAQFGIDPALLGPVARTLIGERVTDLLTRPFGTPRLGALLEGGAIGGDLSLPGRPGGSGAGPQLERGTFLLAKQLVYFERYGAVHLSGSNLLADRAFFEALLRDGPAEALPGIVRRRADEPLDRLSLVESVAADLPGPAVSTVGPDPTGRRGVRRAAAITPALVLVAAATLVWPSPPGVVVQGALVGSLTALTALGLALVWRAKRVVNFAQGDLGAPVAVATVLVVLASPVPLVVALPLGLLVAIASGLLVDWIVVRRFDRSPRLVVTVATIGLAQLLAGLAILLPLRVDPAVLARPFPVLVPGDVLLGSVRFDGNDLLVLVTVVASLVALGWILRRTRLGLAIRASAQRPDRASTLGLSVRGTQAAVWALATGLSYLAVVLRVGTVGVPIGEVLGPGILLRALAAFVLSPRDRLWPIVTTAMGIGVLETTITYAAADPAIVDPVLAGVIAVGLLVRRSVPGDRAAAASDAEAAAGWFRRLTTSRSAFGRPGLRRGVMAVGLGVAALLVAVPFLLDTSGTVAATAVLCLALAATSLVVISGWSGQLSLGQLAFAGIGGAVVAWASSVGSTEPVLLVLLAGGTGALSATVAGLPAFRTRGVMYSVATLAFGVAASATILNPGWATWIPTEIIPRGAVAGIVDLDGERAAYWFTLAVVAVVVAGLWSLGRRHIGRLLRAVRDNPAAAESFGVDARVVTLTGFAIAGAVAGAAGGLLVLQQQSFAPALFDTTESLRLLTASVTGGLDSVGGSLLGASLLYGVDWLTPSATPWLRLASSGVGVLVILAVLPHGIGPAAVSWLGRRSAPDRGGPEPTAGDSPGGPPPIRPTESVGPAGGATDRPPALAARGVGVTLGGQRILGHVDLEVAPGEIVALVGTNGAGKSTLLGALAGTIPVTSGRIELGGRDHTRNSPQRRAGAGLVHVPGGEAVFADLTVAEHLRLATWLHGPESVPQQLAHQAVVAELMPQVGDLLHRRAGELSGGQQQMLAIAMSLVSSPRVLLIDELSLGLAPVVVAELIAVLRRLRDRGVAIVLVEQSIPTALSVADRVVFLEKGAVRFEGDPQNLVGRRELLRSVFLNPSQDGPGRRTAIGRDTGVALRAVGLEQRFGGVVAVGDVSFDVSAGEVVGLIGPNGAGKTSVLDVLSGLHRSGAGQIWLGSDRIDRLGPARRARLGLVRSFQDARLFPSLTAVQVVAASLTEDARWTDPVLAAIGFPPALEADRRLLARARTLLEGNGLGEYADVVVGELSTGVRRMLDLACVAGRRPTVVLFDEPAAGIAGAELDGLAERILDLRDSTGASVLVVEHDLAFVSSVSDRLIAMVDGRVVAAGDPRDVLADPVVEAGYLGSPIEGVNADVLAP